MNNFDFARRFGGVVGLYGNESVQYLQQAHVCVVGIGGVGSWIVEALARSAIGQITLIDLDHVVESNINRQIQALDSELGKAKVLAMQQRVQQINRHCIVNAVEAFAQLDNLDTLLKGDYDLIMDAIDQAHIKAAIIAWCQTHAVKLLVSGGAGGRRDPGRICCDDLAKVCHDSLLSSVRTRLRRDYHFPHHPHKMGVRCVYSPEPPTLPVKCDTAHLSGLHCAGYGSSMMVTASFGMLMAAEGLEILLHHRLEANLAPRKNSKQDFVS